MEDNQLEGALFLASKYPDLHKKRVVQKSARKKAREKGVHPHSLKKEEKINAYIERLQKLFVEPEEVKS